MTIDSDKLERELNGRDDYQTLICSMMVHGQNVSNDMEFYIFYPGEINK